MQDMLTLWETSWKSPSQIENCLFNLIKLNHLNSPHARHVNAVGDHLKKPQSNWKLPFQFDQIEPFEQPSCKSVYHCGRPFEKTGVKLKNALSIWSIWSNWTIWTALTQDTLTLWETIWKSPSQIENCFFNLMNLIKLNHLNSPHARHVNAVGDHLKKPESNWKLPFNLINLIKLSYLNSPHGRAFITVGDHLKRPESNWKMPFQFDQFDQIEPFEQPSCKTR